MSAMQGCRRERFTPYQSGDHSHARPSTAPGLGVCEWSPEGLIDKSVSLIPNTDEILKFVKKKIEFINRTPLCRHPGLEL